MNTWMHAAPRSIIFVWLPITNVMQHFRWTLLCLKKFSFLVMNIWIQLIECLSYWYQQPFTPQTTLIVHFMTLTQPLQAAHLQWLMLTDSCTSTALLAPFSSQGLRNSPCCTRLDPQPDLSWMGGRRIKSVSVLCQELEGQYLLEVLHRYFQMLFTYTLIHQFFPIHFSWKAQYDTSWFPVLAGRYSINFMAKPSAINTALAAWACTIDIK